MKIVTYRKEKGLSQAAFAALLTEMGTPATQGLVSQWEKGTTAIRAERAVQIELATGGVLSRYDLLPAVFAPAALGANESRAAAPNGQAKAQVAALIDSRMPNGAKAQFHVRELPDAEFRKLWGEGDRAKLIAATICDEDGKPVMNVTQAAQLKPLVAAELQRVAMKHSGFGDDAAQAQADAGNV